MRSFREYPSESGLLINRSLSWDERYFLSGISMKSLIDDMRVLKLLDAAGIRTAFDAACAKRQDLFAVHGMGGKCINLLLEVIEGVFEDFLNLGYVIEWSKDGVRRTIEKRIFCWLKDREIKILKSRYGLWDGGILTLREIASDRNLSRSRIGQIQNRAERKLQKRVESRVLAGRLLEKFENQAEAGVDEVCGDLICRMLKAIV